MTAALCINTYCNSECNRMVTFPLFLIFGAILYPNKSKCCRRYCIDVQAQSIFEDVYADIDVAE